MLGKRGFNRVEVVIFLAGILIPFFFLVYSSPSILLAIRDYECKQRLEKISHALHVYAAQDSEQSFPRGDSADEIFRKIFISGLIEDALVFTDSRSAGPRATGTPGPFFLSPSKDLKNTGFLYAKPKLTLSSSPESIIVATRPSPKAGSYKTLALHVSGRISEENDLSPDDFF